MLATAMSFESLRNLDEFECGLMSSRLVRVRSLG